MQLLFDINKLKSEMTNPPTSQKLNNFFDFALNQLDEEQISEIEKINKAHFDYINLVIKSIKENSKKLSSL